MPRIWSRRPAQDCASHLDDMLWVKRRWNGSQAYADTRYQDVLLAVAVARLFPGVRSNALEPGWVPDTPKHGGPVPSRTSVARQAKTFPTESEAKQFAKTKLAEEMKVTAGTLITHLPVRRIIAASGINRWVEEER